MPILRMVEAEFAPWSDYDIPPGETEGPPRAYRWRRSARVKGLWVWPQNGDIAEAQDMQLNITDHHGRNMVVSGREDDVAPVAATWRTGQWLPWDAEALAGEEWLFRWVLTGERIADTGFYALAGGPLVPPSVFALVDYL